VESSNRRCLGIAAVAAFLATLSDLLMLLVANAHRPELHLPPPPALTLWIGGVLGIMTIPCYVLGYGVIARAIRSRAPHHAGIVFGCGIGIAVIGALIHGLTALSIQEALTSGVAARSPVEAITASGGKFFAAWAAGSILVLIASVAIFLAGASRVRALPRWLAWLNPAMITLLLGVAGLPWDWGNAFLLPAAPNLAHALFFAAAGFWLAPEWRNAG
jgi:hypothetical protein